MKKILYIGNNIHSLNETTMVLLSKKLQSLGYNIIQKSSYSNKIFRILDIVWGIIKHKNAKYIVIDTYSTQAFWFAYFSGVLAKFFKIKYIPILHGGNLPSRFQKNPNRVSGFFNNAHAIVCPSNYLYQFFKKNGFKKLYLIPNIIDLPNYVFKKRENFQPNILWVRAFANIYNPTLAIKIFAEIKKKYPNASLTMVGPKKDSSLDDCLALANSLQLSVNFTGKLSKANWIILAEKHDIFINTTNVDNTPVSILEAMALGLPVISTNVGGIPFIIENDKNGILVAPNNEAIFVEKIISIIENKSQGIQLSENAHTFVQQYSWENIQHQWMQILN
jgi:glycosyltransferase involved in cell wall biosynthesis